jgi:hypothetical protein
MRKITLIAVAAICLSLTSCGTMMSGTSGQTGSSSQTGSTTTNDAISVLGSILGNVLGLNKLTEADLYGTWKYSQPGCAFTSDNALAKAGGAVAAQRVKTQLKEYYDKVGIKSSNTQFTFKEDKTFTAKVDGKSFSGQYTFDPAEGKITLQSLLLTLPCYVERNGNTIGLMVESQRLMQILQTIAQLSGDQSLQAIGEISKQFDGVRLGFELTK